MTAFPGVLSLAASSLSQTHPFGGAFGSLMSSAIWSRTFLWAPGRLGEEEMRVALNEPEEHTGSSPVEAVTLLRNVYSQRQRDLVPSHLSANDVGGVALRCGTPPARTYSCLLGPGPPQN